MQKHLKIRSLLKMHINALVLSKSNWCRHIWILHPGCLQWTKCIVKISIQCVNIKYIPSLNAYCKFAIIIIEHSIRYVRNWKTIHSSNNVRICILYITMMNITIHFPKLKIISKGNLCWCYCQCNPKHKDNFESKYFDVMHIIESSSCIWYVTDSHTLNVCVCMVQKLKVSIVISVLFTCF